MNFDLNEYLERSHRQHDPSDGRMAKRIVCSDDFTMSVQASRYHYCSPRQDNSYPYFKVEVGFPSAREETLMEYIDGGSESDPVQSVYGYVPVEIVEEIVNRHGGLKL